MCVLCPIQFRKTNVAAIFDELGNTITLAFKAIKSSNTVCSYDVKNIQIVVCPQPPGTVVVDVVMVLSWCQ